MSSGYAKVSLGQFPTLRRQCEKVEVMTTKRANLRTKMRMGRGLDLWSGQLHNTVVSLLQSTKVGDMPTARKL
jgi:hypothetical protein